MVMDQSIAHTAFVSIREFAANDTPLPEGWALDTLGQPTIDAHEALKGSLLPSDRQELANIGLMVESLAGLAGGQWSLDSPSFDAGNQSPGIGVFIVAINPSFFDPDFISRISTHLDTLEESHGVYIPGRNRTPEESISMDEELYDRLLKETRS